MVKAYKPVVLAVLDGFGVKISDPESTWKYAEMKNFREIEKFYPFTTIQASGMAVGLPWGEEGNSEVGHLTIGAGRTLYHHLPRIITSIKDGSFFKNKKFLEAVDFIKKTGGSAHFMGLFSSGSVHAYADHLYALLDFAKLQGLERIYLHLFSDGKDAPTNEGAEFFKALEKKLDQEYPFAKIATISGRFYAMDRDAHWDRIEKIYACLTSGECAVFALASEYIKASYEKGILDEHIEPAALDGKESRIKAGDAVIFYNFREDSVRELTSLFLKQKDIFFVTMTEYDKNLPAHVAFPPLDITWPMARIISDAGLKQLHISETEKYAHVTYFFNGGNEKPFPDEDRVLIPSPKVPHFDETPEMSAAEVTKTVIEKMPEYDFILVNLVNGDMVGHTGNFDATVKAINILDACVGELKEKILELGGALIVTADHGNAEEKLYGSGEKRTKHAMNPVPIYIIAEEFKRKKPRDESEITARYKEVQGVLSDIAPTALALMGIPPHAEMTGVNLLPHMI